MSICKDCICRKYCGDDDIRRCDRYFRDSRIKKEPTNEEWFASLTTEEKVKALLNLHEKVKQRMRAEIGGENSFYKGDYYREWLKEIHKE